MHCLDQDFFLSVFDLSLSSLSSDLHSHMIYVIDFIHSMSEGAGSCPGMHCGEHYVQSLIAIYPDYQKSGAQLVLFIFAPCMICILRMGKTSEEESVSIYNL